MDKDVNNEEKSNKIDSLTKKLYSKNIKIVPQRFGFLHEKEYKVENSWENKEQTSTVSTINKTDNLKEHRNIFKTFLVVAILFFMIAMVFVVYTFIGGSNKVSGKNIQIDIIGNSFTAGGEQLPLEVEITNQNAVPLELTDLIIEYPKSGIDFSNINDIVRSRISVGTIAPGKVARQKLELSLIGEEGSTKQVKLTLEYRVTGSTVSFRKDKIFPVKISSSPIVVTVEGTKKVSSGQLYTARIEIATNTTKSLSNMIMKLDYPIGFTIKESKPKSSLFNNIWLIDKLEPGKPQIFEISGIIKAENGEDKSIRVSVGEASKVDNQTLGTLYTTKVITTQITKPAIDAKLTINGSTSDEITSPSKSTILGKVTWSNNLSTSVSDTSIVLKLDGELIDKSTVTAFGGYYNSFENTITWNKNTNYNLSNVSPGANGTFDFSFNTLSSYSKNRVISGNPEINLDLDISGKEIVEGSGTQNITSSDTKKIRFTTDFQVLSSSYYYNGPYSNTGPVKPKANTKTTYTIKWSITNTTNPVNDVYVRTSLPINVRMVGSPTPENADIYKDGQTGDIVWKVGKVDRGLGFNNNPLTAYFQVELLPSVSDIGTIPVLIKETKSYGIDSLTGKKIENTWQSLTTKLYNDQNYSENNQYVGE